MSGHEILHRWFEEVWNRGDESAIDRMFAPDGVAHGLADADGQPLRGPEAFKPFFRRFKGAFPDLRIEVVETVREGTVAAVRCVVRGTHTGEGLGIPPTGRRVEIPGMAFVRVEGGQIVEAWNNFDFQLLEAQLAGTAPEPAPWR